MPENTDRPMTQEVNAGPMPGEPATPDMLVNIPRLITAYYTGKPDPAIPAQRVSFGTSGHRGSSFNNAFNEDHILAITQAICFYRKTQKISGPLYLGFDTHALSAPANATTLEVLAANGVNVMIAQRDEYTPTPVISHAILQYNTGRLTEMADDIILTPSHNPPEEGGYKYNASNGGPADNQTTAWIESKANEILQYGLHNVKRMTFRNALGAGTTHRHDYLNTYVNDLGNIIDMDLLRHSNIRMGVDPLGGAGIDYWEPIAERYHLDLTVVNKLVDPTFRFMTVDWDRQIRMDPSSGYAMQRLIQMKDKFDISFACDTDHDRHGIVTKSKGLLPSNRYLCTAIAYLMQNRPEWLRLSAIGKTIVSTQVIDRIAAKIGKKIYEVPVGFKWFAGGLHDSSLCFAGEESAGATFSRLNGQVWTTDKDGFVPALLSAEMTAKKGKDPGILYEMITNEYGESFYDRFQAKASPEQKQKLQRLSASQITGKVLAGDPIKKIQTAAPGNGEPIGGIKVITDNGWFAARPSGTEDLYKIYAESNLNNDHLQKIIGEAQVMVNNSLQ